MQPLRSQHRIERTPEGESAWRLQALTPFDRGVLGALRTSQTVADLLRTGSWSPGDLENALMRMARSGWILIHEPAATPLPDEEFPRDELPEVEDASELEALLQRHRSEQEAPLDEDEPIAPGSGSPSDRAIRPGHPLATGARENASKGRRAPEVPEHDPADPLPFDAHQAENDGLLEALRHPESAAATHEHAHEWAPPSGGLAALLRALGEPVPEGVSVSPDQEERLHELEPVEPWGGSFVPTSPHEETPSEAPFPRLRDQPSDETRPRPQLSALRGSLSKVQQEQAEAQAVRDRARQLRQRREDEAKKVGQQHQANRQKEEKSREGTTLLGLSQRLARVKNDRQKDE